MAEGQELQAQIGGDDDEGGGAPAWIVTFADMMSLLLCFFVLLLSFSTMDAEKFKAVADSLRQAFSFMEAPVPGPQKNLSGAGVNQAEVPPDEVPPIDFKEIFKDQMRDAKAVIDTYIDDQGLSEYIETKIVGDYLKVVNSNPLNFAPGQATLLESSFEYLDMLLPMLQKFDFQIVVEGHTDDRPINTAEFRSNWELSAARAASFVLYMEANGVNPGKLAVHGYGPHRPLVNNDTEENRSRNRRIEILLKEPDYGSAGSTTLADIS